MGRFFYTVPLSVPVVVFFAVNIPVCPALGTVDGLLFLWRDRPVRGGFPFAHLDAALLLAQLAGFPSCEFPALPSFVDPGALPDVLAVALALGLLCLGRDGETRSDDDEDQGEKQFFHGRYFLF
jgi:hypothetical protein